MFVVLRVLRVRKVLLVRRERHGSTRGGTTTQEPILRFSQRHWLLDADLEACFGRRMQLPRPNFCSLTGAGAEGARWQKTC